MKIIGKVNFLTTREEFILMVSQLLLKAGEELNKFGEVAHNQIIVTGTYNGIERNEILFIKTEDGETLEGIVKQLYDS